MGSHSSTLNEAKSTTTIVTNDKLNILNKDTNNFVSNAVVKQAKTCSAGLNLTQAINIGNVTTDGAFDYTSDQSQSGAITFKCVQISDVSNTIANGMMDKMVDALKSNYSTTALTQMAQTAASTAKNEALSTGSAGANSANVSQYNFKETTNIDKNISAILKNNITNNFDVDTVSTCISQLNESQTQNIGNVDASQAVHIGINQGQAASVFSNCIQNGSVANSVINKSVKDLGLTVDNSNAIKTLDQQKQTATATAKNVGLMQSIGAGFSDALKGNGAIVCVVASIILCVIAIFVIRYVLSDSKDAPNPNKMQEQMQGMSYGQYDQYGQYGQEQNGGRMLRNLFVLKPIRTKLT